MMPASTKVDHVILDCTNVGQDITVVPEDEDRFILSVEAAVKACQAHDKTVRFSKQFSESLQKRLAAWISERQEKIFKAFLTIRENGLLFVVVMRGAHYDRAFEDELSNLDLEIANDPELDLIHLDVIALPESSASAYGSFLDATETLSYRRSHPA